jgi:hypothetical protein
VRGVDASGRFVEPHQRSSPPSALCTVLIDPVLEHREWNFGAADEPYPCWICEGPSAGHRYACPAP